MNTTILFKQKSIFTLDFWRRSVLRVSQHCIYWKNADCSFENRISSREQYWQLLGRIQWTNPYSLIRYPLPMVKFSSWFFIFYLLPSYLLLVRNYQAEIIIVKRLIQGRGNVTKVGVKPRLCNHGRHKKGVQPSQTRCRQKYNL